MKREKSIVLLYSAILLTLSVMLFATAPALATYGTPVDCMSGCRPGNNSCTQCCSHVGESCYSACRQEGYKCVRNCLSWDQECRNGCFSQMKNCNNNCSNTKYSFDCPDWVDPNQPCPYDCQMWNPASRSCVGPSMNGCK